MPQSAVISTAASRPHGGDEGAHHQRMGAESAGIGIIGITLRVAQVVLHGGGVGERAEGPVSRHASANREPSHQQLTPAPLSSAVSTTDPAMLRACVHHLRAILQLQVARTGEESVLLDTLDVAMALRLGIRAPPAAALLVGPVPPVPPAVLLTGSSVLPSSAAAAPPYHRPLEGQRTANGGQFSLTVYCSWAWGDSHFHSHCLLLIGLGWSSALPLPSSLISQPRVPPD